MQPEEYDVAVVGSGIGGLCAGALLAHRGYKTLVVDKRSFIGGTFSTQEYEGFKLPVGAVMIHEGAGMDETFRDAGTDLELIMVPKLFWRFEGKDYEMPAKGSIAVMFNIINKLEVERVKLVGGLAKAVASEKIKQALVRGYREPEKETITFRDWLLQYTDNELAHNIFDSIINGLLGGHSYEMPASALFSWFLKMGGAREVGLAPHGPSVEMDKLAKVIRTNGDVWTNCPATRIVVERGRAKGIVVQKDGSEVEIASQVVISNTGSKATVGLAGEENFDDGYLRMTRLRHRPVPIIAAYVASDRPLWPENGDPAILMLTGTRRIRCIVPLSNISPELAPPGQHLLFAVGGPPSSFAPMDKEEEARQTSLDLKEQVPGLEKHGRILKIDPRDINDELLYGWAPVGFTMPVETPVKNLYNVGDGMSPFGLIGTTGAVGSARQVAEMVRKLLKSGKAT